MGITERLNHFNYRFKYRYGGSLNLKVPVDVSLELSSACNQACVYCYHASKETIPFKQKFMRAGTAIDIINEAAELGVNSIKFNYRGESTLHPSFDVLTKHAKDLATGSTFIDRLTNSNFKFKTDNERIFNGLCNQTKVKVSFDSFRKEIFEKQRAGGIYELAIANVDKFYNHPERKDTELVLQAVRTQLNADEDIEGFVKKRWPSATISIRDVVDGRVKKDLSGVLIKKLDPTKRQSCLQAHVRLIFSHDGKAQACCPDIASKINLGDINTQSIKEIFNSEIARQLRKDLKSGKAFENDPCKTCSSHESYHGFKPTWGS